ncbi:MAG: hypothetical protein ACRDQX_10465 [Pseudonocardiaceae bacterium]
MTRDSAGAVVAGSILSAGSVLLGGVPGVAVRVSAGVAVRLIAMIVGLALVIVLIRPPRWVRYWIVVGVLGVVPSVGIVVGVLGVVSSGREGRTEVGDRSEPVLYEPVLYEPVLYEPVLYEPVLYEPVLYEPVLYGHIV